MLVPLLERSFHPTPPQSSKSKGGGRWKRSLVLRQDVRTSLAETGKSQVASTLFRKLGDWSTCVCSVRSWLSVSSSLDLFKMGGRIPLLSFELRCGGGKGLTTFGVREHGILGDARSGSFDVAQLWKSRRCILNFCFEIFVSFLRRCESQWHHISHH